MKKKQQIFFGASVLFSGMYSSTGASAKLLYLVRQKSILGITTQTVLEEVERNSDKFARSPSKYLPAIISESGLIIREFITAEEISPYKDMVEEKDAHVVAGAILTSCTFLVTLDKKHLDNSLIRAKFAGKVIIISPKKLLGRLWHENAYGMIPDKKNVRKNSYKTAIKRSVINKFQRK